MKTLSDNFFSRVLGGALSLILAFSPLPAVAQVSLPATTILPPVGSLVRLSPGFAPPILRGMTLDPNHPLQFEFIINSGQDNLAGEELRREGLKLIKYFLAALTVPEDQMWVNLSPFEPDRIIPPHFGLTEMGRDLLAQDYLLKQLTASLVYPEDSTGQEFWQTIYQQARERLGDAEIDLNTFNKVWIVPEKAVVYEHENTVVILESRLKVLLEDDYFALMESRQRGEEGLENPMDADVMNKVAAQAVREVIVPAIEKEVNEGQTFAGLRQIYHSMILAAWYKINMKETILGRYYADQNKITGIDLIDPEEPLLIYEKYLEAFQSGVFNFIREDYEPVGRQVLPRKYFSGGFDSSMLSSIVLEFRKEAPSPAMMAQQLTTGIGSSSGDFAMRASFLEVGPGYDKHIDQALLSQSGVPVKEPPVRQSDSLVSAIQPTETYGGIDLNPEWLDLQIRRDGAGVPLPLSEQLLNDIHIEGVIPQILNIVPISNLLARLGLS